MDYSARLGSKALHDIGDTRRIKEAFARLFFMFARFHIFTDFPKFGNALTNYPRVTASLNSFSIDLTYLLSNYIIT